MKNLTLSNMEVNVSTSELGKSSATFTGGTLAGINNGTIDSCIVTDSQVIAKSNTTNEGAERNVYHKYGGLVGGPTYPLPDNWPAGNYPMRKEWNPAYFDNKTMTYNPPAPKNTEGGAE